MFILLCNFKAILTAQIRGLTQFDYQSITSQITPYWNLETPCKIWCQTASFVSFSLTLIFAKYLLIAEDTLFSQRKLIINNYSRGCGYLSSPSPLLLGLFAPQLPGLVLVAFPVLFQPYSKSRRLFSSHLWSDPSALSLCPKTDHFTAQNFGHLPRWGSLSPTLKIYQPSVFSQFSMDRVASKMIDLINKCNN